MVGSRSASLTVFVTSALVLVLEIVASRMVAPYVGVSLESFTGIIGTVLAGIATGSAVGGAMADARDPRPMIGQALLLGGVLSWLSVPIVNVLGPAVGSGPPAIVLLSAAAFFLPAAVLSGISPMVAKLRLESLDDTGTVVGGLSAAGTAGALLGTFGTGFVLLAYVPVRTIVIVIGAALVAAGLFASWKLRTKPSDGRDVILVLLAGFLSIAVGSPCDQETEYFCVRIVADDDRDGGRSLYLDRLRHAHVDLNDPTYLDIRYIRLFADVAAALPDGDIDALHIGGGGFSFPRYLAAVRPAGTNTVLEIDGGLVDIATNELGLQDADNLDIRIGDARLAFADLPTNAFDLIVGDAFGSEAVPWHLTTAEVVDEIDRLLRPDGVYVMNVIDGDESRFARAQLATLAQQFDQIAMILPSTGTAGRSVNQILIASQASLPAVDVDPADGELFSGDDVVRYIGDARILTDDFAPVDQLTR